jgi:hypothetical protein
MKKTILEKNIYYYENVFTDPNSLINLIESLNDTKDIDKFLTPWMPDYSGRERKDLYPYLLYGFRQDIENNWSQEPWTENMDKVEDIILLLKETFTKVAQDFVVDQGLDLEPNISKIFDFCKYHPGDEIGPHYDGDKGDKPLLYTMVAYLNDNYTGGEISFSLVEDRNRVPMQLESLDHPGIDCWVKPTAGSVLVFPSTLPYYHQSHALKEGNKYISTVSIYKDGYDMFKRADGTSMELNPFFPPSEK